MEKKSKKATLKDTHTEEDELCQICWRSFPSATELNLEIWGSHFTPPCYRWDLCFSLLPRLGYPSLGHITLDQVRVGQDNSRG
jgi:hypothetical protein